MNKTLVEGGFALLPAPVLAQVVRLVNKKALSGIDIRIFLSLIELKHIRTVENCHRRLILGRSLAVPMFTIGEISKLTGGVSEVSVSKSLRRLKQVGVAQFSASQILLNIPSEPDEFFPSQRKVPIPRRILKFLVKKSEKSLLLTALVSMLRGLFIKKGTVYGAGRVKISLIKSATGVSKASILRAKNTLVAAGLLIPDSSPVHSLVQRFGSYFAFNLDFGVAAEKADPGECVIAALEPPVELPEKANDKEPILRPIRAKKESILRPPIHKQKPPSDLRNQNLRASPLTGAKKLKKISLRDIQENQIRAGKGLVELYRQAVEQGWFVDSSMNFLNFVASAVKSVRKSKSPVRLFVWTVRNGFRYISNQDEERAQSVVATIRRTYPDRVP